MEVLNMKNNEQNESRIEGNGLKTKEYINE